MSPLRPDQSDNDKKHRMLTNVPLISCGSCRFLDVARLISWLSSRQYAPEGGFSGRTNKLVDGCYSHWVGGCWPLIEAALSGTRAIPSHSAEKLGLPSYQRSLYSREGLIRYTMCCCQDLSKRGGLRDKPGRYVNYFPPSRSQSLWFRNKLLTRHVNTTQ